MRVGVARWALGGALGLWVAAGLCGCAALQGAGPSAAPPPEFPEISDLNSAAPASVAPASVALASAAPASAASAHSAVSYRIEVNAPGNLKKLLETHLDLARFRAAPNAGDITNEELIRLTASSRAQARSLLETEGYFAPVIDISREDPDDELPLITLQVTPGPRTVVAHWELRLEGDLQKRLEAHDPAAQALLARVRERWPLPEGAAFSQSAWSSAKSGTAALLRSEGYPATSPLPTATSARIDAKTHQASLLISIDSGPLFHLGALRIEGLARYHENAIRNIADFSPGTPYSEKRLSDFQERLTRLDLFNAVSVEIDADPTTAAAAPVKVRVQEKTMQEAVAGVGFSDNTRERFTLEHRHRRPFGLNLLAHNKFELGRTLRSWESELLSNPVSGQYRNLVAGSVSRLDTADDVTLSWRLRVGRTLYTERIERLIFGELLSANVETLPREHTRQALSANYNWVWRDIDNIVLPTRGLTSVIQLGGGLARATDAENGPFTRLYTRNTLYWPLGNSWFTQTRIELAQVFAQTKVGIPDPLLFRAGGDESVRGYSYRELGPRQAGVLTSGRKLLTASAEIAHPFSASVPSVWWAAFIDAGNAADQWDSYEPALGYGVGLRWRSPAGPLRIDWAYGEELRKGRLHFSVGIAF